MSIQRYLHGRSYATDCTCERGLRPAAAKCICLRLAHVRPYKTAHYSRVMPRTHVAASFFFSSTLCELPLKASRRPFLHASFLSSLSSFPRCPLLFSCFFAFLSSSTSFLSSPFFFLFFFSPVFLPSGSPSSPRRPRDVRHVQMRLHPRLHLRVR